MSDLWTAVILGLVEGITEYLPVSSTGHLILFGDAIGFADERAKLFDVFIQLGAILAVLVLFLPRFLSVLRVQSEGQGLNGRSGMRKLIIACAPALVLGAIAHKAIKEHLFYPRPVAAALILGGVILILIERICRAPRISSVDGIGDKPALIVGIFQCLALWPGMSRSGSTIVGGMLLGFTRSAAAEFSFLVAVPIMCAAVGFDMLKGYKLLHAADLPLFATGFVVSFVSAMATVKLLISFVRTHSLAVFGWYRFALGALVLYLVR